MEARRALCSLRGHTPRLLPLLKEVVVDELTGQGELMGIWVNFIACADCWALLDAEDIYESTEYEPIMKVVGPWAPDAVGGPHRPPGPLRRQFHPDAGGEFI
jgi:hypothetical protein